MSATYHLFMIHPCANLGMPMVKHPCAKIWYAYVKAKKLHTRHWEGGGYNSMKRITMLNHTCQLFKISMGDFTRSDISQN